jgi:hypothetical protein
MVVCFCVLTLSGPSQSASQHPSCRSGGRPTLASFADRLFLHQMMLVLLAAFAALSAALCDSTATAYPTLFTAYFADAQDRFSVAADFSTTGTNQQVTGVRWFVRLDPTTVYAPAPSTTPDPFNYTVYLYDSTPGAKPRPPRASRQLLPEGPLSRRRLTHLCPFSRRQHTRWWRTSPAPALPFTRLPLAQESPRPAASHSATPPTPPATR